MSCFVVPVAEAIVTTVMIKAKKDVKAETDDHGVEIRIPFSRKLRWLNNMLWGGSALLAFEHLWHGEVVPWFPFLTAASNPADTSAMLHEMSTVGVSMAILVTGVWAVMVLVTNAMEKKVLKEQQSALNLGEH